jgi:hypothetical protein
MGNGCFCLKNVSNQFNDVKLDSLLEEQNDIEKDQLEATNLYNIVKYFNEGEKEINTKIEKRNVKRILSHKKAKNFKSYNVAGDSKYELMLKRLLEQKKIERKGPKRRKTLRVNNNKNIAKLINEVIEENKNNKKEDDNVAVDNSNNLDLSKKESILLNYRDKSNLHMRQSLNITKFEHKIIENNFEETEINNGQILNDIKNLNNASNYISDANYACLPRKSVQKK